MSVHFSVVQLTVIHFMLNKPWKLLGWMRRCLRMMGEVVSEWALQSSVAAIGWLCVLVHIQLMQVESEFSGKFCMHRESASTLGKRLCNQSTSITAGVPPSSRNSFPQYSLAGQMHLRSDAKFAKESHKDVGVRPSSSDISRHCHHFVNCGESTERSGKQTEELIALSHRSGSSRSSYVVSILLFS